MKPLSAMMMAITAWVMVFAPVFGWNVAQSAASFCTGSQAVIGVSFTNNESSRSINVVATDLQSGASTNLGTVTPGQTKPGTINTGLVSLSSGTVRFNLTWANGSPGSDQRFAGYSARDCTPPPEPPEEPPVPPPSPPWTPPCIRTVRGRVLDRFGNPIVGILVEWDGHIVAATNNEGNYEFPFTPQGEHAIRVLWEDYNLAHGTSFFFSQPQVTVVVGEACYLYWAPELVDPFLARFTPGPAPTPRPTPSESHLLRFEEEFVSLEPRWL